MELYLRYLTPLHEGLMGMFPRHNDCRMGFYLHQSVLQLWGAIEHIEAVAGELAGVAQTGEMVAGIGDDIELVVGRGHRCARTMLVISISSSRKSVFLFTLFVQIRWSRWAGSHISRPAMT